MKLPAAWSIVIGVVVPILVITITKAWDPVAEYLGYPFDVRRRVNDLGKEVETLHGLKADLLRLDPSPLSKQRAVWVQRVEDLLGRAENIRIGHNGCGLNYFAWCYFGKEAGRELQEAKELACQGGGLLQEARAAPRPVHDRGAHHQDRLWGMDSYKQAVLHFVNDDDHKSRLVGIWGMGGVGKSSLLELVEYSSSKHGNHNFHPVLFVQAGRGCTVGKLQDTIARKMALPLLPDETSQGHIIFNHLKDKNFLLLLDDLWGYLDLKAVGIPMPLGTVSHHRRKVVFTTRSLDVCGKMGCRENSTIRIGCLGKEDAWKLFADKTGDKIVNDAKIHPHANEIVEECGGLPMALCMIGKHMSAKKDHKEWRGIKDLLKNSMHHESTSSHEDLFKCLKESYDNLPPAMKERFLLCSLWPENENICMKKLISWWTGLGLLDGFHNASDIGYTLINDLVRASMLEKGDNGLHSTENSHVKMHSMIRKMALWIVNKHTNKWLPHSSDRPALSEDIWRKVEKAWVSQEDISKWGQWFRFPELKMLVAQHVFLHELSHYFRKMTFLDLEGMKGNQFPLVICRLTELQHLNLSATALGFLPPLLEKLSKLKYLYIRNNMDLQEIPKGLILALKRLRGLDLFCTGASFPNVLEELARSATDLDMLGLTVRTVGEITKLGQLKRVCTQALCMHQFEGISELDTVNLQFLAKLRELRELAIVHCFQSEKVLVAEGGGPNYNQQLLPHLEIFELNNLLMLEKVTWKNAGMNIRVVNIYRCDGLKDVTWVHHLKSLEQLTVAHCQEMERLIETGELPQGVDLNQTVAIIFPLLKKLELVVLPKLCMISHQACEFKELSYICVTRCNEMKGIHNQVYKQRINIYCSEDWWENSKSAGTSNPYLVPICS